MGIVDDFRAMAKDLLRPGDQGGFGQTVITLIHTSPIPVRPPGTPSWYRMTPTVVEEDILAAASGDRRQRPGNANPDGDFNLVMALPERVPYDPETPGTFTVRMNNLIYNVTSIRKVPEVGVPAAIKLTLKRAGQ